MTIHLRDYLTGDQNTTPAIRAALAVLHDGDTLSLDGGFYELWPDGAQVGSYFISNNDSGEKPMAFPLIGRKGITIDGGGAELLFHGRILPFAIDGSEDITIKNLSIDYASPFYARGRILEADRYRTVLHFDSRECGCRVKDGKFCFYSRIDGWECVREKGLSLEFERVPKSVSAAPAIPSATKPPYFPYCGEKRDHGFLGGMFRDVSLRELAPDTIEMYGDLGFVHTPGNYLIITHSTREFPGFFLNESRGVTLQDIRLYYTSGMGIIGQLSENITLERVVAGVREGSARLQSVNADATHFVNCRGKITMRQCKFTNMMDDACNIHGIYAIVKEVSGSTAALTFGHFQQRGINLFRPGDTAAFIAKKNTETLAELRVISSELTDPDTLMLTVDGDIPACSGSMVVENLSTAPEIVITDTESGHNRPRGFLLSSRGKTLVERCRFYNMNTGVQVGCELRDWYESSAALDVTIRDCDFTNSAYAGGTALHFAPKLEGAPDGYFHGRISVENCHFEQAEKRILRADLVQALRVCGCSFKKNPDLPPHSAVSESGFAVTNCGRIDIEELIES